MGGTNQAAIPNEGGLPGRREAAAPSHLDDFPETLKPYIGRAVDWLQARGETFDRGVRVQMDDDEIEFRGWSVQDVTGSLHSEDPAAAPMGEVLRAFALMLKARDDLKEYEERREDGDEQAVRFAAVLESDLNLFTETFDRVDKAIDATVLRGGLVSARNLSRFRDLLLTYRHGMTEVLETAREAQKRLADTERVERIRPEPAGPARPEAVPRPQKGPRPAPLAKAKARRAKAKRERPRASASPHAINEPIRFPVVFFLIVVLAVTRWGILAYGNAVSNHEPVLEPAAVEELVPMRESVAAGGVLYGTVDDNWHGLPYRDRRERFDRLQDRASNAGFLAVVLVDEAGAFKARWRRGGVAEVWTD
jgi:hypothetical protein